MEIKNVYLSDIPAWILLSKEYDCYVQEIIPDLTEWYDGSGTSISFDSYMRAKINQNEAFMSVNENNECCGLIAISKRNNRITFFAVSHKHDFNLVGEFLLDFALSQLNSNIGIKINVIKSSAEQIQKEYILLDKYCFTYFSDDLENGVPVNCMEKIPGRLSNFQG